MAVWAMGMMMCSIYCMCYVTGSLYAAPTMGDLVTLLKGLSDWQTFGYCLLPVDKEDLIEVTDDICFT